MFENSSALSGISVDNLVEAKKFYVDVLGLTISEENGKTSIKIPSGGEILIFQSENHRPSSYPILSFPVSDLKKIKRELSELGVECEDKKNRYITFNDPAGNILSAFQDDSLKLTTKIHLAKFIPEECSVIYHAWLDPSVIDLWAIPESTNSYIECFEPVKDGQFLIQHDSPKGIFESSGRFLEVIPNEKLAYELQIRDGAQNEILNTTVVINFYDEFSGTNLVLEQEGFETPDYLSICEKKWNDSLDKLHYVLTSERIDHLAHEMHLHP